MYAITPESNEQMNQYNSGLGFQKSMMMDYVPLGMKDSERQYFLSITTDLVSMFLFINRFGVNHTNMYVITS